MFTCLPFRGRRWHAWLTLPPRWLCVLFLDILRITETNASSCVCESALYATGQSRDMFLNISKWWDDKTCTKLWGKVCSQLSVPTLGINQSASSPPDGSCPPAGPGNDAIRTERLERGTLLILELKRKYHEIDASCWPLNRWPPPVCVGLGLVRETCMVVIPPREAL